MKWKRGTGYIRSEDCRFVIEGGLLRGPGYVLRDSAEEKVLRAQYVAMPQPKLRFRYHGMYFRTQKAAKFEAERRSATSGLVTVMADMEYNADEWWAALREEYPLLAAELLRTGRVSLSLDTFKALCKLPGYSEGPDHARTALLLLTA